MITILWLSRDQCHYMAQWKSFSPRFQGRLVYMTWRAHGWYMSSKIIANQKVKQRSTKALQSESKLITFTRWTASTSWGTTLHPVVWDFPPQMYSECNGIKWCVPLRRRCVNDLCGNSYLMLWQYGNVPDWWSHGAWLVQFTHVVRCNVHK